MPEPTPGQVAYEAFDAAFPADRFVRLAWAEQAAGVQAAWEAAAQAVLAQSQHAHGAKLHTMLTFLITHATPDDLDAVSLWLSEAVASLHAEMQYYPDEEQPHA